MSGVRLNHGAATDVGRVRRSNEDAHLVAPPLFVVADGMGGHDHGDVASRLVVEEFARLAEGGLAGLDVHGAVDAVAATCRSVRRRIAEYDASERAAGRDVSSSGSTAVVAAVIEEADGPRWLLANVGDSRIYRFFDGRLEQVSVDHSVVQEMVEAGRISPQQAADHPSRNMITRALGVTVNGEADYFTLPLEESERVLLCSDGVTEMLPDSAIRDLLARIEDAGEAAERLVAAAVEAGGRDNATAVVIDVVGLANDNTHDSGGGRPGPDVLGALRE